jgi:hypothetical protein
VGVTSPTASAVILRIVSKSKSSDSRWTLASSINFIAAMIELLFSSVVVRVERVFQHLLDSLKLTLGKSINLTPVSP